MKSFSGFTGEFAAHFRRNQAPLPAERFRCGRVSSVAGASPQRRRGPAHYCGALPIGIIALSKRSRELGLDVLCEAHSEEELHRALDSGCELIGVNNRDLRTFKVDVNTALRLAKIIPKNVVSVAESGIDSGADISRLRAAGYRAFLIGESLMRAESPGEALKTLLAEAEPEGSALTTKG
jgi:hypothetical protein